MAKVSNPVKVTYSLPQELIDEVRMVVREGAAPSYSAFVEDALREAVRVLAPSGLVFIRDLRRPDSEASLREIVESYAGEATAQQRDLFEASLRASLTLEEVQSRVEQLGFDPGGVTATSDRHWTWNARKPQETRA